MSARSTAIAVVALLVLGVALIAQAWRMKDYSLNVSIARERQDDDPEMLRKYHRYSGVTEVRFWSVAWICTGLLAQAGWVADDRRLAETSLRLSRAFARCRLVTVKEGVELGSGALLPARNRLRHAIRSQARRSPDRRMSARSLDDAR